MFREDDLRKGSVSYFSIGEDRERCEGEREVDKVTRGLYTMVNRPIYIKQTNK